MDTRRLYSFVKIVDTGSITRAADILHIAQPALSQQVSTLEAQFKQQLLIRSKRGVEPTAAGRALYRHAQIILRTVEQAQAAVSVSGRAPAGTVSVGLAPCSIGSALALPLLQSVRRQFPDIVLHVDENFGGVLSEAIMTGRIDLAFIYEPGAIRGVRFERLLTDELALVAVPRNGAATGEVSLAELAKTELILPPGNHTIRQVVDAELERISLTSQVVAESASIDTLIHAVRAGIGGTILPAAVARRSACLADDLITRPVRPSLNVHMSLCIADQQPLSDPALVVHNLFTEIISKSAVSVPSSGLTVP